jgi:DMSO reductase anchor subunit
MSRLTGHTPLVWFTSLAIGGAGVIATEAVGMQRDPSTEPTALMAGTIALAAGMLISTLHLGRPLRAPLAARGARQSALSQEIVLAGAALASAAALLLLNVGRHQMLVRGAACGFAVLFLLSIGRVYVLGGHRTWNGPTVLLPLTTGLVAGSVFVQAAGGAIVGEPGVVFWMVAADALAFAFRWRSLARPTPQATQPPSTASRVHNLFAARLLAVDILPIVLLDMNAVRLAVVAVAFGLAFDRWLFYALASQHTTEEEIARIEAVIERESRIS